ncbi:uncharacterized protein [Musca autumnalis]|uniref:uncharacterized protein n=1 Tax=Musca autumnalis TaxID=221902 RepID=UPI003CF84217
MPKERSQCNYCCKWYASRPHMLTHFYNMHTAADSEHRCDICGHVSSTPSAHYQHKRFKHDPEKKHKCSLCEKAFKNPSQLKQHLASHTGTSLCECKYCPMTFTHYSNRHTHMKRMHPQEYAKMVKRPRPTAIIQYDESILDIEVPDESQNIIE